MDTHRGDPARLWKERESERGAIGDRCRDEGKRGDGWRYIERALQKGGVDGVGTFRED